MIFNKVNGKLKAKIWVEVGTFLSMHLYSVN